MRPSAPRASSALFWLCAAGVALVLAFVFALLGLGLAYAVALVSMVGLLVMSLLVVARNGLHTLGSRFPRHKESAHVAIGHLTLLILGGFAMWWAINGLTSDEATLISRRAGTVRQVENPVSYWASIAFYFALGLLMWGAVLYIACRRRSQRAERRQGSPSSR